VTTVPAPDELVDRVRAACADLPEVEERPSHSAPTFFVRGKKSFVSVWPDGHHDNDFPHLWCAAAEGVQSALIAEDSDRFFRPPYVGHRGWLGIRLDREFDDDELLEWCEDAYRVIAPATLVHQLDTAPDQG
jgi:hypothetical protein